MANDFVLLLMIHCQVDRERDGEQERGRERKRGREIGSMKSKKEQE
jgi:hypothetical protein